MTIFVMTFGEKERRPWLNPRQTEFVKKFTAFWIAAAGAWLMLCLVTFML